MLLYTVKICRLYWFNKTLIGHSQAGNIGRVTRLGEFWEEEKQRDTVASQTQKKQDENALLRKK